MAHMAHTAGPGQRFDAFVMVDWSAANTAGPVTGAPNGIWVAIAEGDRPAAVTPHPARAAATTAIATALRDLLARGRRVLVGWDFVFGYPEGTAAAIGAEQSHPARPAWRATWEVLRALVTDDEANRSNRFAVADELNRRIGGAAGPFWGQPHPAAPLSHLTPTKGAFPAGTRGGAVLGELRGAERALRADGHRPKSAWQLYGAGSVGSQGLVGIPRLMAVRDDPALAPVSAVWPFETGFALPASARRIVHAEVYPSLLPPDPALHPVEDAAQVVALVAAYRSLEATGSLAAVFGPPDVPKAARVVAVAEEGWVLPVAVPRADGAS